MYLTRDRVDDGQQLPLARFLANVAATVRDGNRRDWRVMSARGYGEDVCDLEDSLEGRASIPVRMDELLRISSDPDQWFYDLHCVEDVSGLRLGVLDSGALYIRGSDELCRSVTAHFEDVTRVNPDHV